jgi:hypothetical protein
MKKRFSYTGSERFDWSLRQALRAGLDRQAAGSPRPDQAESANAKQREACQGKFADRVPPAKLILPGDASRYSNAGGLI